MSLVYLAPFIVPELHLTHSQVGLLVSALALAWAVSSLIFGIVSDRVGRRPVGFPSVFIFSALSWGVWNRADVRATVSGALADGAGRRSDVIDDYDKALAHILVRKGALRF